MLHRTDLDRHGIFRKECFLILIFLSFKMNIQSSIGPPKRFAKSVHKVCCVRRFTRIYYVAMVRLSGTLGTRPVSGVTCVLTDPEHVHNVKNTDVLDAACGVWGASAGLAIQKTERLTSRNVAGNHTTCQNWKALRFCPNLLLLKIFHKYDWGLKAFLLSNMPPIWKVMLPVLSSLTLPNMHNAEYN